MNLIGDEKEKGGYERGPALKKKPCSCKRKKAQGILGVGL
jgi:hypothetical protein